MLVNADAATASRLIEAGGDYNRRGLYPQCQPDARLRLNSHPDDIDTNVEDPQTTLSGTTRCINPAHYVFGVCYLSIGELIGWPAEARIPEHFQLHWATVVEPDKLNGLRGSIYLWTEGLDENNMLAGHPVSVPATP